MKICSVKNCNNTVQARELCNKHYKRFTKYGDVNRSQYKPNKFIIEGEICRIFLKNNKNEIVGETIIDTVNFNKVKGYKWNLANGYANSGKGGRMHRLILNAEKEDIYDYINRNKLDNRKENLRFCNYSQNIANSNIQKRSLSGYKGVSYHKSTGKWRARIRKDRKEFYLGIFDTPKQAALIYNIAAEKLHKEFAGLNNVE